jgi:UDP-N-acetylmuramyl pentapeptide synthase
VDGSIEGAYFVGPHFSTVIPDDGVDSRLHAFDTAKELGDYLQAHPMEGKTILVKGSRGMALEQLYEFL